MRDKKWVMRNIPGDYNALGKKYGIEPLLLLLAKNRGVEEKDFDSFFFPAREHLHDPAQMRDAEKAADILCAKIKEGKRIRVIGDYDIDGVCATVILTDGLKRMGAEVDFSVPHRVNDGYGLNMNLVSAAIDNGVDTIITCDNGIAAYDEIRYAVDSGLTVIVTDHHEIPYILEGEVREYRLPPAQAVVDIKREDETYPFRDLCGAAVAWKLITLLERRMKADIDSYSYVELAGFATVGDVMKLKGENRTITALGLEAMRHSSYIGLKALMDVCRIAPDELKCHHIGFRLGPCINATGRLDTAERAVRLLLDKDESEASEYASELYEYNSRRQELTERGVELALEQIGQKGLEKDNVLVVYIPGVHESIAGIIAGRLREKYYKPVIVLTDGEECVKGSGRSVEGYSMFDRLSECREFFIKFGGHPMAAGMSLDAQNVDRLREFLNSHDGLDEETLTEKITIDAEVPFSYFTPKIVGELEKLEPTGNGNTKPVFAARAVEVRRLAFMGSEKQHVRMTLYDGTAEMTGVMWHTADEITGFLTERFGEDALSKAMMGKPGGIKLDIMFSPDINVWKDSVSVQLHIKDYR